MNRGDREEAVFHDDQGRELFAATLAEACAKPDWQDQAYCLLGNGGMAAALAARPSPDPAQGRSGEARIGSARPGRDEADSGPISEAHGDGHSPPSESPAVSLEEVRREAATIRDSAFFRLSRIWISDLTAAPPIQNTWP